MMEQSHTREGHGDVILVTSLNDIVVTNAASSLGDISHSTLVGTLNIVAEGEESV